MSDCVDSLRNIILEMSNIADDIRIKDKLTASKMDFRRFCIITDVLKRELQVLNGVTFPNSPCSVETLEECAKMYLQMGGLPYSRSIAYVFLLCSLTTVRKIAYEMSRNNQDNVRKSSIKKRAEGFFQLKKDLVEHGATDKEVQQVEYVLIGSDATYVVQDAHYDANNQKLVGFSDTRNLRDIYDQETIKDEKGCHYTYIIMYIYVNTYLCL